MKFQNSHKIRHLTVHVLAKILKFERFEDHLPNLKQKKLQKSKNKLFEVLKWPENE